MKNRILLIGFSLLMLAPLLIQAQPFTLDKEIKPVRLQLKEQKDWKGAKAIGGEGKISKKGDYYFVKGATMFQPIDIFLLGPDGKNVKMKIVKNNWEESGKTHETIGSRDEIANAKIRTYGDFGIHVYGDEDMEGEYQLVVFASPEMRKALPSPFVKKGKESTGKSRKDEPKTVNQEGKKEKNSSGLIYILGGAVAILVIVVVFLLRKRNKALVILLMAGASLYPTAETYARGREIDYQRILDALKNEKAQKLNEQIKALMEAATSAKDLLEQYFGLGDCLDMPLPPGMPFIPSYCAEEEEGAAGNARDGRGDCANCFAEARSEFDEVRYNLEQLRIIYKCTKDFSKKAIAFGDNTSGIHGISGMAWQAQRAKIEGSVKQLEDAYDKKYAELMLKLHNSMIQLAICEEEFGMPDWYDNFGYMFYEFIETKYKRSDN